MSDIKDILINLGYPIKDMGTYYNIPALYRDGKDCSSVAVYKNTSMVVDFVSGSRFFVRDLIKLSLGLKDIKDVDVWLQNHKLNIEQNELEENPKLKGLKTIDKAILEQLKPNHAYWVNRGIDEEVIKKFQGGICDFGRFKDYYVFPIFNSNQKIIGLSGRALSKKNKIKWRHYLVKSSWNWPLFLNIQDIKEKKEVVLLESIGDSLSCYVSGVYNVFCLFGLTISPTQIKTLLSLNIKKITIGLNNDKNKAGNIAAENLKKKLGKFFHNIEIKLPNKGNDWNEVLLMCGKEEIKRQLL